MNLYKIIYKIGNSSIKEASSPEEAFTIDTGLPGIDLYMKHRVDSIIQLEPHMEWWERLSHTHQGHYIKYFSEYNIFNEFTIKVIYEDLIYNTTKDYKYRGLSCNAGTFGISGVDGKASGILEWCFDLEDAEHILKEMSKYSKFKDLKIVDIAPKVPDEICKLLKSIPEGIDTITIPYGKSNEKDIVSFEGEGISTTFHRNLDVHSVTYINYTIPSIVSEDIVYNDWIMEVHYRSSSQF